MSTLPLFKNLHVQQAPKGFIKPAQYPVWTENKARLVAKYLYYFVMITRHGIYIDGFAAPKRADLPDTWAADLVLRSEPKFLKAFFLCEKDPERAVHLHNLKSAQPTTPKRLISVHVGDFNETVHDILASGHITEKKATFCLLDQYSTECHWSTVKALASHKTGNKIELFYFLATGWVDRALKGFTKNKGVPEAWWGRDDWQSLLNMKPFDRAQLFCERFKSEFGYKHVHAWPIYKKTGKRIMFHMIHASDHDEAPVLMSRAYRNATTPPEPQEQLVLELRQLILETTA
jgi:three-Cys-motif partner protein